MSKENRDGDPKRAAPGDPAAHERGGQLNYEALDLQLAREIRRVVQRYDDVRRHLENARTQPADVWEVAQGLRRLQLEFDLRTPQIAEILGRSPAFVFHHLSVFELTEAAQKYVQQHAKTVSISAIREARRVEPEIQARLLRYLDALFDWQKPDPGRRIEHYVRRLRRAHKARA